MKIEDIEITQSTLNKIWSKHGVNVKEIFEVFWNKGNKPKFRKSKKGSYYICLGRTIAGRYLLIAFAVRGIKAKILTARDMTKTERRLYKK
jgi:hypothetical protein